MEREDPVNRAEWLKKHYELGAVTREEDLRPHDEDLVDDQVVTDHDRSYGPRRG
jgi:hypothetical protein